MSREPNLLLAPGDDPPDQEARLRIDRDLETNLLVEAGAGSGKTTALVQRMVAIVGSGQATVDRIAAVTFTRKAAAELRERFQVTLEGEIRKSAPGDPRTRRLMDALRDIDQAFLGTIHAFCARLLRERPLEAGLDPDFEETLESEAVLLRDRFWQTFLERLVSDEDPVLEELAGVGLRPDELVDAFVSISENLDLRFPVTDVPRPRLEEIRPVRSALEELLERALAMLPGTEPEGGWDPLQSKVRSLDFSRRVPGWDDPLAFFDALATICRGSSVKLTQRKWAAGRHDKAGKARAKELGAAFQRFASDGGPAATLLEAWYEHRYPIVVRLVRRAADEFAAVRRRTGRLSFQDLLLLAARLLRESPRARRDLGERYRHVLVDEFQDTDPVQAEVVLLLASDPSGDPPDQDADWRRVSPRPGALFVVGDPKQSIYRFRRADIATYGFVKERFRAFGDVLELVTNFRSRQGIADLVNEVFAAPGFFPLEATPHQAPFAPLVPYPKGQPPPREGVFYYTLRPGQRRAEGVAAEAAAVASWIRGRVDACERRPEDFLVLTRKKKYLEVYARALEQRNVPVDVSGAGVSMDAELRELTLLLEALGDPEDQASTVAVLLGLFFGIDFDRLLEHRLAGGRFAFSRPPHGNASDVERALLRLHDWWRESSAEPADVFIGRLVRDLGLLPFAAAGSLGALRAGALIYALDAVRAQALAGDTSLRGAVDALKAAIDWADAEAPLEPGRGSAVRVMNVHKAKGLEAPVVMLVDPGGSDRPHAPSLHVLRGATGLPSGYLSVQEKDDRVTRDIARPPGWGGMREAERRFEEAEEHRVLYVSVTRAGEELVVASREGASGGSPWGDLEPWLEARATLLPDFVAEPRDERERVDRSPEELAAAVAAAEAGREARREPTYRFDSVTGIAKEADSGSSEGIDVPTAPEALVADASAGPPERQPGEGPFGEADGVTGDGAAPREAAHPGPEPGGRRARTTGPRPRGYEWGSVVHGALAAAARGLADDALRLICRSLLVEFERPVTREGEPRELDELLELVDRVQRSRLWSEARASSHRLAEVPFATRTPGPAGPLPSYLEGVIDLVYRVDDGWVIADYKTDLGDDPGFPARRRAYLEQVELYGRCWEAMTGDRVRERVILYTSLGGEGREERW